MSNKSVITLRVASELKQRLAQLAENEGVSMNQLISYFLTESVTAMEMRQQVEARFKRIEGKSVEELRVAALAVFDDLRKRQSEREDEIDIPDWDRWPNDNEELPDELLTEQVLMKFAKAAKSNRSAYQPPSRPSHAVHEPKPDYKAGESD